MPLAHTRAQDCLIISNINHRKAFINNQKSSGNERNKSNRKPFINN